MKTSLHAVKSILIAMFLMILGTSISQKCYAQGDIYPSTELSFTGAGSVCQNSIAPDLNFSFDVASCGASPFSPIDVTVTWFSNTTNTTSGGSQVSQVISSTLTTSYSYTPSTAIAGTLYYYVEVSWGTGSIICATPGSLTSNETQEVIVNAVQPVSVNIGASATTICTGSSVTFTATPTNGGVSPSYQWQVNGINAGTNNPVFTTTTLANNDIVTVIMTSDILTCLSGNPATSNGIQMSVNSPLAVSVSIGASATTICAGASVTFTATPTNGGTPSYQWKLNGINAGTNSPIFTTTTLVNADVVTVVMTSSIASCTTGNPATSNPISMTVNALQPVTVNIGASATTICAGASVTFTATPTNGGGSPSYQWKVNGVNSGTNSPTFTTNTLANGNTVTVVMTSNITPCATGNPATSNSILMTVNAAPTPVTVTPSAATICQGTIQAISASTNNSSTVSSGTISVSIPDNSATGSSNTLNVSGIPAGAVITGISANFNITHGNVGDLIVNLKAPNNSVLNFVNRRGGTGNNFTNTTVSSTGVTLFSASSAPFTGTFAPDAAIGIGATGNTSNAAAFSSLYGTPNGNWVLSMRDAASGTSGTLTGWSITITWSLPVTWSPVTDLFTDPAATIAYAVGQVLGTVYAKPASSGTIVYTATATGANGCTSTNTSTLTVNPTPTVSATPASQPVCTGTAISQINITNPNNVPGTVFSWVRTTPGGLTGIANSGSGSTISGTFTNSTTAPITTTFTITATAGTCSSSTTVTVTVNPIPTINAAPSTQTKCSGTAITNIVITNPNNVAGTTYSWTRDNTTNITGIGASGTGTPVSGTLTNITAVQQTTIFTITASAGGCSTTTTSTAIVNPGPTVSGTPLTQTICSGTAITQIDITNPNALAGTVLSWTRDNTVNLTGIAASGGGASINGTLTNTTAVQQTTIFTLTATAAGCASTTTVNVKVNPTPTVNAIANLSYCNNANAAAINFGSNVAGATFAWTSTADVGFGTSGNGNIPAFIAANGPVTTTVGVTATANGCPGPVRTFTITINPLPSVSINVDYCSIPGKVRLTAIPLPAGFYTYSWTTGASTQILDVDIAGTYSVTVTNTNGCKASATTVVASELAVNGNFEAGNTGFTTGYNYVPGGNGLQPEGNYAVNNNPNFNHTNFWGTDHTSGSGKMMIVNGVVGPTVWQENVTVTPNTTYYFSAWALSMNNLTPFAQLQFSVNGNTIGTSAVLVAGVNNNASNNNWQRFYGIWSSGPFTTATCSIVDLQGALGGNDFALDDISISTLSPAAFSVFPSVLGGGNAVCQGNTLNLTSNLIGGSSPYTFSWTGPAGFTSNIENPSIPNVTAANSGTYTLSVTDFYGCVASASRMITVNAPPAAPSPVSATPSTICFGSNTSLNATMASGTQSDFAGFYAVGNWSTTNTPGLTGGSINLAGSPTSVSITSGNNGTAGNTAFTIANGPVAGNYTFNWSYTTQDALASRDIPQYSINGGAAVNVPGFNTAGGVVQSGTASIAVPANQTFALIMRTTTGTLGAATTIFSNFSAPVAGSIEWYTVPTFGTSLGSSVSGANFTVTPPGFGVNSYYAEANTAVGCLGSVRTQVDVTVNQPSSAATTLTATPNIICSGTSVTLTQSGGTLGTGATWKWYSNNTYTTFVGNGIGANASLSVSPVATTTYYLRAESAGPCPANVAGPGAGVTVTVRIPSVSPASLNASVNPICKGSSTTLSQTGGTLGTGATWKWYSDAGYTTFVGNGTGATASLSVSPIITTTYYLRIEGTTSPCTANVDGPVAGITVTVNQPSAAATTLTATPNVICNGSSTTLTQTGGSLGTGASWKWYSNNTYTTFVGNGSGANASLTISPAVTTTYYLRAEGATSPCTANVAGPGAGVTVTVNQPSIGAVSLNASVNPICKGSSTTLTQTGGSLGMGASWKWYSDAGYTTLVGTGTGATASLSVSPIVTTTYYLRIEGTTSPCTANADGPAVGVTVVVNQPSVAVTSLTATPSIICGSGNVTLTQTGGSLGTGASWAWYSDAGYTTFVGTGSGANASLVVTPAITTTYYLRAEGATSPCTANIAGPVAGVTVTVSQPSVAATALNASASPVCSGTSTTLTQTGGSLGSGASWKWYSDAGYTTLVGTGTGATASLSVSPVVTTTYYLRIEGTLSPCSSNVPGPAAGVTVIVNQKSANPVSASASPLSVCSGSSATLTIAGGGGGDNETIVWYTGSCGGTIVGTGNNFVVNPLVTTTYYGRYENGSPCNYTSSCVQVTVTVTSPGTWLGVNTDWHNAANWCGGVPATTTDVIIPFMPSGIYPIISTAVAMAHDITLLSGTSLDVSGQTLQISGAITNSGGMLDASNGGIELNGTTGQQAIAGSMFSGKTLMDLRISNTSGVNIVGTNDTLRLSGVLKFGVSNAILNTNGNLTLISTALRTASVGDMTNNGTISGNDIIGNVTVERYIPNHSKAWQFMAVPTMGQTVKDAWQEGAVTANGNPSPGFGTQITSNVANAATQPNPGFDVFTPAGPSMKVYDAATNGWIGIPSTSIQINNQKGYMLFVRGDRSVTVYNQAATETVLRTTGQLYTQAANAPAVINVAAGTFESIGNPYASAIDFSRVTKTGGVQDIFYVWDPKLTTSGFSVYGLGGYQTVLGPGPFYTVIPGGGSYDNGNTNIESGQAFLVHAPFSTGTIAFSETSKDDASSLVTKPTNPTVKQLRTNLYVLAAGNMVLLDGTLSQFNEAYSNEVDDMDALKLVNTSENLGMLRDGKKLVAERRANVESTDTIFYNLTQSRVQQYQFEFIPALMDEPGLVAFLEDKYLHTSTVVDMRDTTRVMFNIINDPGSYAADRFMLTFKQLVPTPVSMTTITATRNSDKTISIRWKVENETNIKRYTVERSEDGGNFTGIITADPTANNGGRASYMQNDLSPLAKDNFYRIKALDINGAEQFSAIVKVAPLKSTPGISVYPNPVTGKTVQLQFVDQATGKYSIALIYSNGMKQQLSSLEIQQGINTHAVALPQFLAAGVYHLQIMGPDGNSILKTITVSAE